MKHQKQMRKPAEASMDWKTCYETVSYYNSTLIGRIWILTDHSVCMNNAIQSYFDCGLFITQIQVHDDDMQFEKIDK